MLITPVVAENNRVVSLTAPKDNYSKSNDGKGLSFPKVEETTSSPPYQGTGETLPETSPERYIDNTIATMSSWVMKPPPLPKNASRLTGKVCDITGKPIQLLNLRFASKKGHFFPESMNEHALRSDKNGDYYYDIPEEYLPDTFHIRKRGYYEYAGGEEIIPPNFKNLHQIVYIKKNETVHLDLMIDELPRTRPWWHFKYNTGKCNAPWPF
jgi:hypothetical protein